MFNSNKFIQTLKESRDNVLIAAQEYKNMRIAYENAFNRNAIRICLMSRIRKYYKAVDEFDRQRNWIS